MLAIKVCIVPLSPFGTLPKGDTLFGQLCWASRNHLGEDRLVGLLEGYTAGRPFAVVSDAFPAGHLPRPALPGHRFSELSGADRKEAKRRAWLPEQYFGEPVERWLRYCREPSDMSGAVPLARPQPHNAIDRRTGTTGEGFAPYAMTQHWYHHRDHDRNVYIEAKLDVHVVLDETRLTTEELTRLFEGIGALGFGRDASIGLGKFRVESVEQWRLQEQPDSDSWLALAPCAPQSLGLDPTRSFYQVFTRFGRHGDIAVHTGKPFKTPVLLAQTAAVLTPARYEVRAFIGRGLGGDSSLSKAIPQTVQQGYAPVMGIRLPPGKEATA